MTSGTWWCPVVIEMVLFVSSSVVVASKAMMCLCCLSFVPCVDSGRKMESQWSLSVSLCPLHQSWNLPVSGGPVQGAKPAGNYFCFLYCPFLAALTPCPASLPGCVSTNASVSKGRTFTWVERGRTGLWQPGEVVLYLIHPKTTELITRSHSFEGRWSHILSIASSQ